jgi:molecular chaperone HtpG
MPVAIKFGTKTENWTNLLTQKIREETYKTVEVDIINNPNPAWTKQPTELDEDYKNFYHELYPCNLKIYFIH